MTYQQVRSFNPRGAQQRVQLKRLLPHSSRRWPGVAPGGAGAIVATDPRKLRDARLDQTPVKRKVARSGNQHHCRTSRTGAVKVQTIAADVDQSARGWIGMLCLLSRGYNRPQEQ